MRDHLDEEAGMPLCEVMHRDVGLNETPLDDAQERSDALREERGMEVAPDSIKLTQEHFALHRFLKQMAMEALIAGQEPDELLAVGFVLGRRYGLKQAAELMG